MCLSEEDVIASAMPGQCSDLTSDKLDGYGELVSGEIQDNFNLED